MTTVESQASPAAPTGVTLAVRYSAFAAIATGVNLAVQAVVFALYGGPFALTAAMGSGTIAGLLPKYVLDKKWIFVDQSADHARKFSLYTLMAVVTTLIFWAVEFVFDRLGHGGPAHYLGAVIGLALGYWLKYRLDRRFVFTGPS